MLERICCGLEGKSAQDRHAAGFFLFLLYARARYSDGQNVASLADSPKYLEFKVGRSKTSFTLERKTRFLPMAARKVGVKHAWATAWLEVMGDTGVTVAQSHPLLPCPSSSSSWKMIPLPCDQAGAWLRSLLRGAQHDPYLENVGTHSLKRTLLSWASKRGLPRDQRALLGYHSSQSSGAGSELIYESDAQSAPLRALSTMIDEVSAGDFRPDQPRGQQLSSELKSSLEPPGRNLSHRSPRAQRMKRTLTTRGTRHASPKLSSGTARSTWKRLILRACSSDTASQGLCILRQMRPEQA